MNKFNFDILRIKFYKIRINFICAILLLYLNKNCVFAITLNKRLKKGFLRENALRFAVSENERKRTAESAA